MDRALNDFDRARGRMAGDFRTMITDSEALLKAAASVSGKGFAAARTKFEDKLKHAKATLAEARNRCSTGRWKALPSPTTTYAAIHGQPSASRLQPEC